MTSPWKGLSSPGLSPRVRGNLPSVVAGGDVLGSIPACAGEPRAGSRAGSRTWVYPRVCGGTVLRRERRTRRAGLSPRVRGNQLDHHHEGDSDRSIPACAGEPRFGLRLYGNRGVYPRVCGGTAFIARGAKLAKGLSPRVRGNPVRGFIERFEDGSIPACAGEPQRRIRLEDPSRVYPRVCGGTIQVGGKQSPGRGLSPRVRGNRDGYDGGRSS